MKKLKVFLALTVLLSMPLQNFATGCSQKTFRVPGDFNPYTGVISCYGGTTSCIFDYCSFQ
ncbi:MAG: hypothetical protein U1C58_10930 [Flavobacteriaceae bacterium]|nr:hypothetical protein [Flavobacteriaceae bacterium]